MSDALNALKILGTITATPESGQASLLVKFASWHPYDIIVEDESGYYEIIETEETDVILVEGEVT